MAFYFRLTRYVTPAAGRIILKKLFVNLPLLHLSGLRLLRFCPRPLHNMSLLQLQLQLTDGHCAATSSIGAPYYGCICSRAETLQAPPAYSKALHCLEELIVRNSFSLHRNFTYQKSFGHGSGHVGHSKVPNFQLADEMFPTTGVERSAGVREDT